MTAGRDRQVLAMILRPLLRLLRRRAPQIVRHERYIQRFQGEWLPPR
jgi:hypothetical protein